MKRFIYIAAASLLLVSCGALNTERLMQGASYATQALTLPESDVIAYVQQYITALDAQSPVLPETNAYTKRLRNLTARLTQIGEIPLNYKVYKNEEVNAFACADGSVRVYTGIMDLMNDEQLLSVIAHEIGHVALKHTYNQMRTSMLTSAAFEGLAATSDKVAVLTDSQLGAIGQSMINNHFSKKQESQADEFSYEFLVAAKRNPWVMVQAFEKLQSVSGGSSVLGPVSSLFSTHPDTATRIKTISKMCERDGFERPQ
ncbi:MAG: M48 family metallopeptidase [Bacteroidales bacterium]|nr:M48 family metallopeptidase [Bacteroidales bacterium]